MESIANTLKEFEAVALRLTYFFTLHIPSLPNIFLPAL
jgi:hypothetical protein